MTKAPRIIAPGTRFGKWKVLAETTPRKGARMFSCVCDCGNVGNVQYGNLMYGQSAQCTTCATVRHGLYHLPEYWNWADMRKRCEKPSCKAWKDYGGRGITVCERWKDFGAFIADMGQKPGPKYSLERIDNDKGYSPENCKWALPSEQVNNRRNTAWVRYQGRDVPMSVLARSAGLHIAVLRRRLILGWPVEDALTRPVKQLRPRRKATEKHADLF